MKTLWRFEIEKLFRQNSAQMVFVQNFSPFYESCILVMPIALLEFQDPMIKCFESTFQRTRPHDLQMGKSGANGNFK